MKASKLPVLNIPNLKKGIFLTRPNRFVAEIEFNKKRELAHIHDPGRLKELLIKGSEILFVKSYGKLKFYIKAVRSNDEWILIDTALHSRIAEKIFRYLPQFSNVKEIKKEVPLGNSRIDFMLDKTPLEVKGVTLVKNGIALFPDAPTKRGTRHVQEIIANNGILLFLIFCNAQKFSPNYETDPDFSIKLSEARNHQIPIITARISFDGFKLYYNGEIPLANF
ncbi:MAG: DNA/RNA nuclease SfsA [Candidatus Hermodarchaeota archaeon]